MNKIVIIIVITIILIITITNYYYYMLQPQNDRKEGNALFNDALNTFYLRLYGVRHMVKDHSDSERRNPPLPHRLLFLISSKGCFICFIPHLLHQSWGTGWNEK